MKTISIINRYDNGSITAEDCFGEKVFMFASEYQLYLKNRIWNDYQADQQDGFVSNIDTWLESKIKEYPDLNIKDAKEYIEHKLNEFTCLTI